MWGKNVYFIKSYNKNPLYIGIILIQKSGIINFKNLIKLIQQVVNVIFITVYDFKYILFF